MTQRLADLVEQFCQYQQKQRGKAEGGVKTYRWMLEQFLRFVRARQDRLARVEDLWLARALRLYGFASAVAEMLPCIRPKEYFRPGQVDATGRFNNVAIGRDPRRPRFRLPGGGGIPDVTTVFTEVHLYVPRHSRAVFVERVDFASSLGHSPQRRHGRGPQSLVSDLGVFDFADGRLRLTHLHPGVDPHEVDRRTGFPVDRAPSVQETPPPTKEELSLLQTEIDPLDVRQLEFLSGSRRRQALESILLAESGPLARAPEGSGILTL